MTVDLRLALPTVFAWLVAAIFIAGGSLGASIVLWGLAGGATAVSLKFRSIAVVALAAAAAALVCTSIAVQEPGRLPTTLVAAAESGHVLEFHATATETVFAQQKSFGARLDSSSGTALAVPVRVFADDVPATIAIGARVVFSGSVVATESGDDTAFLVFARSAVSLTHEPPWYLGWANGLRASFRAVASALPGEGGDLLPGLAIGDTSAINDELDTAMKSSSLSHLTAVSGANCAIVIGLIMTTGAALGLARAIRVVASAFVLLAFVVLVTPDPSVLRAAVMACLVLVALARGRPVRGVPVLALAALALLLYDPWLARNYGFVLSVLATAGLLVLAGPIATVLERWMPRWIALVLAVPVAAQLACQPIIILLNASLPTYGVIANVLAAPAAPVATIVGLAACILLVVIPPLGQLLCALAWLPSAWIAAVADFFANAPGAQLLWPSGWLGVGMLAALSAVVVASLFGRRLAIYALAAAVFGYAVLVGGSMLVDRLGRPPDWQIAACDIGQGDAVFVRSEDQIALFDTGPEPRALAACLADLGIGHIDLLVLTHFHLDHYGGIAAIADRVDVALVGPSSGPSDDAVVESLRAGGAQVRQVHAGPTGILGDLRWTVLWPPSNLAGIELGNASSIAVELQPVGECARGCISSVFLGDLGEYSQARLLASHPFGHVDVVKVGHHGSADQSEELYARLHATAGVICVGKDNGYGHPSATLLDILARSGTRPYRSDLNGLILIAPGGSPGSLTVWSQHPAD